MFKYVVKGYGCDGAGESEEWTEYAGTDRLEALNGYKRALAWMGSAIVNITVLGREWQKDARQEREFEIDEEEEYFI